MATWTIQDAKTNLGQIIARAGAEGPQLISHHGHLRAVLISIEADHTLAAPKPDFCAYLLGGSKVDEFPLERDFESPSLSQDS